MFIWQGSGAPLNPFAAQQGYSLSTDAQMLSPPVTAIPQPSLLPGSRTNSVVCHSVSQQLTSSCSLVSLQKQNCGVPLSIAG